MDLPDEVRIGLMIAAIETDPNLNQRFNWTTLDFEERSK